jgi:two-component system, OmpR family, sensor histidine kinase BaeS
VSLAARLLVTVVLTALFSVSLTGYLSHRSATERVPRAFGAMQAQRGGGAGPLGEAAGGSTGAMGASRALLAELRGATLNAAVIALAVAVLAGGWIALRASGSIVRLADVTRRYGDGERTLRATPQGPTEVLALARVFNQTADRVQAEEERRKRFTTDVAHELRTPLSVLKSELEAVQDGLMEADAETVRGLLQQVDLLGRLVADLRLVTLAEAGELPLHLAPTDLGQLARDAVRGFETRAKAGGVRVAVAADTAWVVLDRERLRQVLLALLDNALRHVAAGGAVEVRVRREGSAAVLEVLDDGQGIAPEDLPHVFRRFYRGDRARSRDTGGSGLGLAIAAAIVALHEGRIAASPRAGGGTRFRIDLPLSPSR